MNQITILLGGILFRVLQIVVESSLYLLIGFLTAGALRGLVGPTKLRAFFGAGRWSGPIRAWAAAATLLPVCALGVLPVLRELKRAGVRRDVVLTFALAAPMLNPISLLYGLSYLGPGFMLMLALGTLAVAVLVGLLSGVADPSAWMSEAAPDEVVPSLGLRRVTASAVHAACETTGPILRDIMVGVLGASVMAACLQPHWLSSYSFAGDPGAIPLWSAIAPLTYVTPEKGVVVLPEMLKFRQSTGAMFCLMALGVGMTLGHLSWIRRSYGFRTALRWAATALLLSVAGGYIIDRTLPPVGTANVDNDHFEEFANRFDGSRPSEIPHEFGRFASELSTFQWEIVAVLTALMVTGMMLRRGSFGCSIAFEDFLDIPTPFAAEVDASPATRRSVLHAELPRGVGTTVAACCGLMIAMAGGFAFFPSPDEVFRDMTIIKADLYGEIGAGSLTVLQHHLDLLNRQAARLPIGAMLRLTPPGEEARRRTEDLRSVLRDLRVSLEAGRRDEARSLFTKFQGTYDRCRSAYAIR